MPPTDTASPPPAEASGDGISLAQAVERYSQRLASPSSEPPDEPDEPADDAQGDERPDPENDPSNAGEADEAEAAAEDDGADDPAASEEPDDKTKAAKDLDPDRKVRLKVDGREVEVRLGEVLDSYSFHSRNAREAQRIADERKAVTSDQQAIREERQYLANFLTAAEGLLFTGLPNDQQLAALRTADPQRYLLAVEDIRGRQAQVQALHEAAKAALGKTGEEVAKDAVRTVEAAHAEVMEAIPELRDPAKAAAFAQGLHDEMVAAGYATQDVTRISDPRVIKFVHKALSWKKDAEAYRALQAKKVDVAKRVADAPKPIQPGQGQSRAASREGEIKAAQQQARKSGSLADAVRTQTLRERAKRG